MKNLIETLTRGVVFGGAFGAKTGVLIGSFSQDVWTWITYLFFVGIVVGLIGSSVIVLNKVLSPREGKVHTSASSRAFGMQETILVK